MTSLGPTTSSSVVAGCSAPDCVKRSPHSSVRVVVSKRWPHSQPWGRWGVASQRTVCLPSDSSSPSSRLRAGRSATSSTERLQASTPQAASARGAAASTSLRAPLSSPSQWLKLTQRRLSKGSTVSTAALTTGNMRRMPVW